MRITRLPAVLTLTFSLSLPVVAVGDVTEIVVTTRKREENIQDVPIAVSVLSADQISRQGINSLRDVAKLTPSLKFDTAFGPQDTRITIRGLSNTRGRSNVAFLVDGIDVTTENVISAGSGLLANRRLLTDVERIEVVKGPQSALYGRAAFAGAISYITKEPTDEFEAKASLDIGDYGRRQLDAAVGGPVLGEMLGMRLTGFTWNEDGYYENSVSGEDVGGGDGYGAALTAVFKPMEEMKWKGRVEFSDENYDPTATVRIAGDTDRPFLPEALEAGIGFPITDSAGYSYGPPFGIGIFNTGTSFRLPSTYGSADGKRVRLSEDWRTGSEYPGTDTQVFRASLTGTWDLGWATASSYSGYTDGEFSQRYDQDYQAQGRPDALVAAQEANTQSTTSQFSQELRLQSQFDGPVQVTVGGLYWKERRDLTDNNFIIACLPVARFGGPTSVGQLQPVTGICDGTAQPGGPISVSSWQQFAGQLDVPASLDYPGAAWEADTDHLSWYFAVEWKVRETVKITFEDRFINEEFFLRKANQSSCTSLGFPITGGFTLGPEYVLRSEADNPGVDVHCEAVNTLLFGYDPANTFRDWAYISGEETSRFSTPKVTVDWQARDNALLYFSWASAQKPGGINQLSPGGQPVNIDDERFLPEKMEAWELGVKSDWDAAGFLQANAAVFFEDYTDKQVSTQRIVDGQLQPQVVNASGAEVWGAELELLWSPAAVDGLTLTAGYTYLDPTYTTFKLLTRNNVRAAALGQCDIKYLGANTVAPEDVPSIGADDFEDPSAGNAFCLVDFGGHDLERTARNSFAGSASLRRPLGDIGADWLTGADWLAEVNGSYQSERYLDEDNFTEFEAYWTFDARVGVTSDNLDVLLYVDNLFDDDTLKTGGSGPDFGEQVSQLGFTAGLGVLHYFGTLPDPRMVGVRMTYRFGGE